MVATSTMTRGAVNSRRMTVSSMIAPYSVPTASATTAPSQYGTLYCVDHQHEQPGADEAHVADGEVDDAGGAVDEHDAHRQQAEDQPRREPVEDELLGVPGGEHGQPPSVPRNTARTRSSRSTQVLGPALEPHLALLEEHGPVGDRQRHVERLLDDHDRHPLGLEPLDDLQQLLHDDRREAERQLVDEQHVGVVQERDGQGEHLLLAARHRTGRLVEPPGEVAEQVEHPGDAAVAVVGVAAVDVGADLEVLAARSSAGTRPCRRAAGARRSFTRCSGAT